MDWFWPVAVAAFIGFGIGIVICWVVIQDRIAEHEERSHR